MNSKDLIVLSKEAQAEVADLPKLFKNYMTAHSEFQIRNFILNDGDFPTVEGKYHQAIRELYARYQNLINLSYQYKKLQNEIDLHALDKDELWSEIPKTDFAFKRRNIKAKAEDIEIEHKTLRLQSMEKQASETLREMRVLLDMANVLDEDIPAHFRDDDGMPDREKSEAKFWIHKQRMAEVFQDPSRTPFNHLTALNTEGAVIVTDKLKRLVVLTADDAKQLRERRDEQV